MDRQGAGSMPAVGAMSTIGAGYALDQLARAMRDDATGDKVAKWRAVLDGMRAGALAIGSRTPTAAPPWVTLEVAPGGFATGRWLAGGPPRPHERTLAAKLGVAVDDRRALTLHYLTDEGRAELRAMLANGHYQLDTPEAGALLVMVALLDRGATAAAGAVLDAILPFADRLRFFPIPTDRADAGPTVRLMTVGQARSQLAHVTPPPAVAQLRETLAVWTPMTDAAVALLAHATEIERPPDWRERARALLGHYGAARAIHRRCRRPHRPGETLATAIAWLTALLDADPDAASRRRIGALLATHAAKHGAPGSARRATLRAAQAAMLAQPTRADIAKTTAARLATWPDDGGVPSLEAAWPHDVAAPFASVRARATRCLDGTLPQLVSAGVLTSAEAVAQVLPQVSARARAHGLPDAAAGRLAAALDAAFGRRRSLLLVGYQAQVRLDELPWVAALDTLRRDDDGAARAEATSTLATVARLAVTAFPQATAPNPLIVELRGLAQRAARDVPLVPDLAADIFQGGFTAMFVRAAAVTATRLADTTYARYYDLPIGAVQAMAAALPAPPPTATPTAGHPHPGFGALCLARAGVTGHAGVAANGCIIEQAQILTSGNTVALAIIAELTPDELPALARRCVTWMLRRLRAPGARAPRRVQLAAQRQAAIAWRQAIALLSLGPPAAIAAFLDDTRVRLARRPDAVATSLAPHLDALDTAARGEVPSLRLLGWSVAQPR